MESSEKKYDLEEKLKRLETIASRIQNPNIGIDDALKLYKEGISLSKKCKDIILSIETEVKELSKDEVKNMAS